MRLLLPLLILAAACDGKLEPGAFQRGQPGIEGLHDWDGALVVDADRWYRLDLDEEKALPIEIPGLETVSQLLMRGDIPLAVGTRGAQRVLLERKAGAWTEIPLPAPFAADNEQAAFVADATSLVLVGRRACFRRRAGEDWREVPLPPRPWLKFANEDPNHAVLQGDLLVLGLNRGPYGGALVELDLGKGSVAAVALAPVRQLKLDAQGRVWAVEGVDHLSAGRGGLRVREGGAWRVFCDVRSGTNWSLPPMAFAAMDVDAQGHPWILGDAVGLVRWTGAGWSMATREWPSNRFQGGVYPVPATGLRLRGESTSVLALGDAGVALLEPRRNRWRRISLKP